MADSFILTDGTTSFELVYDAGTQDDYKLEYGTRVQLSEPAVLMHSPDDGESLPIRAVDRDREVYLTANLPGDDWDTILDNITKIKRLVDGADSQALRYWTQGDVDRVVLRIQKDGSTNYTDLPVKFGFVDDSGVYYTTIQTKVAWKPVIMLMVAPYGEGAQITLRNDLPSSPHFVEDSNGDGLADGWTLTGSPPTVIETNRYLVGGQSQAFQAPASATDAGINLFKAVSGGEDIVAYAWVNFGSGSDDVSVILQESGATSNIIDEVRLTRSSPTTQADKVTTGAAGNNWYRVSVSGTANGSANGVQLRIRRKSTYGSTQSIFNVDACYLELNQTTVPDAWCSTSNIENRNDPDSSNEDQISYIDVWGVPGDSPALLSQSVDTSDSFSYLVVNKSRTTDGAGTFYAAHFEGEDLNLSWTDPAWQFAQTDTVLSSASAGNFTRITVPSSSANASLPFFSPDHPAGFRVFMRARVSNTALKVYMTDNDYVDFNAANTWETVDLGYVPQTAAFIDPGVGNSKLTLIIEPTSTGYYIDLDDIWVLPVTDDGFMLLNWTGGLVLTTDATQKINYTSGGAFIPALGSLFTILPFETQRLVFITYASDNTYSLDDAIEVTLTVTPRARHLLGTI
jgi:hypothetical protein